MCSGPTPPHEPVVTPLKGSMIRGPLQPPDVQTKTTPLAPSPCDPVLEYKWWQMDVIEENWTIRPAFKKIRKAKSDFFKSLKL